MTCAAAKSRLAAIVVVRSWQHALLGLGLPIVL
jgi:hypothetical protein